jgi:hypothetical protein
MSDEPHLPGYSVDDDDPHGEPQISEPESPDDVILVASSAGAGDPIRAENTTLSPSSQPVSTPTPPEQQQAEERGLRGTNTASTSAPAAATTPPLPERPAVDDFADPKVASLHAIFPDYDAALL